MSNLKKLTIGIFVLCFALLASLVSQTYSDTPTHAANTLSGTNEVINIATTDNAPPDASIGMIGVSGDGNVILFTSAATNLPNSSTVRGVYAFNIKDNSTTRIDVSTTGALPNSGASNVLISESGRYVLLQSRATNLIDGTTSYADQLYIRDISLGTTARVTNQSGSSSLDNNKLEIPLGISNDGRFVLDASRYIVNDYPYGYGIVYGDRKSGTPSWTSLGNLNYSTVDDMHLGGMSCDGSFVVYQKYRAIYLADLRNGGTTTLSVGSDASTSPIISCNGTYILYVTTDRTDISPTPSGLNSRTHLVLYNRISGMRQYIDSNSLGTFSNGYSANATNPSINIAGASVSDTGDVVFMYNGNVYLKHLSDGSGTLESIAKTATGTYVNVSNGQITNNGKFVFFKADPYDLGLTTSPSGSQIIRAKTNL